MLPTIMDKKSVESQDKEAVVTTQQKPAEAEKTVETGVNKP
jgi:hypothetical protein